MALQRSRTHQRRACVDRRHFHNQCVWCCSIAKYQKTMKRLPASVLEANGAFDKNPNRQRVDLEAHGELGNAPTYFTKDQVAIWHEIKEQLPVGLAKSADRMIVEIACRLMHTYRTTTAM